MKQRTKRPRLAEKLKKVVQNLSVDVFGYETKVTKNISNYFSKLSKETGVPQDRLVVRIFKDRETVAVGIYHQGRPVKKITLKQLIPLFINSEPPHWFRMETKVTQGIENFMMEFANTHHLAIEQVQLCITSNHDMVWIKGYKGVSHISDIPLGTLIQYFTSL